MRKTTILAITLFSLAAAGCVASSGGGGGSSSGTGTGTGSDTASGTVTDTTSGSGSGDNTKNTAAISGTGEGGQKSEVKVDKAAKSEDATAKQNQNGAVNAGKILNLYVSEANADGSAEIMSIIVDTEKVGIPGTGIPVGKPGDAVSITYFVTSATGGGTYTSTGKGTIDISTCPAKSGEAVVGKLNGVEMNGDAVLSGPKTITFNGSFNLVYFGGAGQLMCKAVEQPKADAGSTETSTGGGGTCDGNFCDNGANKTRNCCPHLECIQKCYGECGFAAQSCVMGCGADSACSEKCVKNVYTCSSGCFAKCNVNAGCLAAAKKLDECEQKNGCSGKGELACVEAKCCAEAKAVF
ncbi:MAG: hypothetical protein EXR77_05995 [Myxococcales bacterium]|nr:hypothetical protein [Myxococcales bacterium]